uniref:Uncharacterized protein n=1 Tax=Ascaris lumbricoides TaxID=6252 RepID=A0A9J2PE15_ASCLU
MKRCEEQPVVIGSLILRRFKLKSLVVQLPRVNLTYDCADLTFTDATLMTCKQCAFLALFYEIILSSQSALPTAAGTVVEPSTLWQRKLNVCPGFAPACFSFATCTLRIVVNGA